MKATQQAVMTATCKIELKSSPDMNRISIELGPVCLASSRLKKFSEPHFINELLSISGVRSRAFRETPTSELANVHIDLHDFVPTGGESGDLKVNGLYPFSVTIRKAIPVIQELLELLVVDFITEDSNGGGANN